MDKATEIFRHPDVQAVGLRLLLLYCVSLALFFAVDRGNRSASEPLKDGVRNGRAASQLFLFALAVVSNVLAVLTFLFIGKRLGTAPRLTMIGLPLLFLVEKHLRAIRADRENRRLELILAVGTILGVLGAACALMRGCPVA